MKKKNRMQITHLLKDQEGELDGTSAHLEKQHWPVGPLESSSENEPSENEEPQQLGDKSENAPSQGHDDGRDEWDVSWP